MDTLSGHIRLDFRSPEPIYLQIVRQVEQLMQDGILKSGDQLPTVRQMAIDLRINFSTVARAYNILDEKRLISTQRGRGTYIWEEDQNAGQTAENQTVSAADADRGELAERLALEFIDSAFRQGFSITEIRQAFDRAAAGRISKKELLKNE